MSARLQGFVRSSLTPADRAELARVRSLADRLHAFVDEVAGEIDQVNVPQAPSSAVQSVVERLLHDELGFAREVVLTPQDGIVTRSRPDFVFRLSPGRGILAEVERGGTTTNNHDLKDFWKTHLAPDAHHLFLVVPNANWNVDGRRRERPYDRVCRRLAGFFGDPRREVDVLSLHVFGYGLDSEAIAT